MADNGTLLLDEIGELSLALQAATACVAVWRYLSASATIVIARGCAGVMATNRDLREEVLAGVFAPIRSIAWSVFPSPSGRSCASAAMMWCCWRAICEQCRLRLGLSRVPESRRAPPFAHHGCRATSGSWNTPFTVRLYWRERPGQG